MSLSGLWIVLSLSFVVALSGAVVPGPLFTYTVARTAQSRRRGYLTGLWVVSGHALLEAALVLALLLGISELLKSRTVLLAIGTVGCGLLLYMGYGLLREAIRARSLQTALSAGPGTARDGSGTKRLHPVAGGVLISMSNPYWWIWWISVGSALMLRFDLSLRNWPALLAFFLGHEAGDLAWYLSVSSLVYWGKRRLSDRFYRGLLAACGIFLIGFGIYLAVSLYLQKGSG